MAKAFWKGAISFGMVSIPVKMYVATISHAMSFHLLHKKCLTKPRQVLYCQEDNEYFGVKDTVRAYEYGKGQYVVLKNSDFDRVPVRTTHIIDILCFVKNEEIDPTYFYGSHYLEPEEFAVKPYCLLRESLRQAGRIGIAKVSFQRREHLCCLRPRDKVLALHTIHYRDEVLSPAEVNIPEVEISAAELNNLQAYCVKCRAKREIKNPKSIIMKNRRPATQGVCPVCGTNFSHTTYKTPTSLRIESA